MRGSSPLARGLPAVAGPRRHRHRIIPARAGFTQKSLHRDVLLEDHPRSRGVYSRSPPARTQTMGSSPLARGLRRRENLLPGAHEDHPRSRGVYGLGAPAHLSSSGSSPLARGLLLDEGGQGVEVGIIPARAGFTMTTRAGRRRPTDHPRSRGVYPRRSRRLWLARGSSPLARGLRLRQQDPLVAQGIIPARAGFTLADPWNPNEPVLYQTPAAFTADPGPAPPSCGSAVVVPRWTTTPSGA